MTVPAHKVLAKGTLSGILNHVGERNGISKEELLARLQTACPAYNRHSDLPVEAAGCQP